MHFPMSTMLIERGDVDFGGAGVDAAAAVEWCDAVWGEPLLD